MNTSDLKLALGELFHAVDGPKAAMFWIKNMNIIYVTLAMVEEGPVETILEMESRVCSALLTEIAKKMALRACSFELKPVLFWRLPPTVSITKSSPDTSIVQVRMRLAIPDLDVGVAYWRPGGGD